MAIRLILLFTALPLIEIYLLVEVGTAIGVFPTVLVVAGTGVAGAMLARHEGISVLKRTREKLQEGELPAEEIIDGMILLVSGAFLLTPGILTDVIGLVGLVPWFRRRLMGYSRRWFKREWEIKRKTYIDVESDDDVQS